MAETTATLNETKAKLQTAAAKGARKVAPKARTYTGRDLVSEYKKLLAWGHSGDGKTHLLLGPVLAGERLLVGSADFGGQGLTTVVEALKRLKKEDLLDNIRGVDLTTYEEVVTFVEDPGQFFEGLETFAPTVDVLEGFSGFQIDLLDEYILSFESKEMKDNELRDAGLVSSRQDWAGMKRGTMRVMRKFLGLNIGSTPQHKIVTALGGKQGMNDLTKATEQTPLIQGSARDLIGAGFDLVLRCASKEVNGKVEYFYHTGADKSKFAVKTRGVELPSIMDADPLKLWSILTGKGK